MEDEVPPFEIDYSGNWHHDGSPVTRKALAKLFSDRALMVDEQGRYWLKTPYEQYEVLVADVPYIVVDYEIAGKGEAQAINLYTNMEEVIELGRDCQLLLRAEPMRGLEVPYVEVRKGLMARLNRNVLNALMELALAQIDDPDAVETLTIKSRGTDHPLGKMKE